MTRNKRQKLSAFILSSALLLSQTLFLAPQAVLAADDDVRIAGQTVLSTRAGAGSMTAQARAEAVQKNLDNALVAAQDRAPSAVNIVYVKGLPVITLSGYQVVTVTTADAKAYATTPALLAKRWADAIRHQLTDQASIHDYVAQLSGDYASSAPPVRQAPPQQAAQGGAGNYYQTPQQQQMNQGYVQQQQGYGQQGGMPMQRGRVVYAPAGLTFPVSLNTAIATQVAKPGDMLQATISQPIYLGDNTAIPAGSVVIGQVTEAKAGGFFGRSGRLTFKFNRIRTPDGVETPITAHLAGGIEKFATEGNDTIKGETMKNKFASAGIRGLVGAGTGAALGTAVGAIAGGGRGAGRGAWSGTAIGGGVGAVTSMTTRKGRDVTIPSGQQLQLQLDAPATLSAGGGYVGNM
jgi:hypothetical protein